MVALGLLVFVEVAVGVVLGAGPKSESDAESIPSSEPASESVSIAGVGGAKMGVFLARWELGREEC